MVSVPISTNVAGKTEVVSLRTGIAFRLGYRPGLDGLRALAVLVVMAHHAFPRFFNGGQVGVDVFFVLSGFLITSLLLQERDQTSEICLTAFYFRRALRLLPALVGLLLVAEGYSLLRLHGSYFWMVQKAILAALCYAANWMRVFNIESMGPLAHTWSLSIEEQFYLLWPPILLMLLLRVKKSHIFAVIMLLGATVAFHRFSLWTGEASWERIYNGTDTRFDELLAGCGGAVMLSAGWWRNRFFKSAIRYVCIPSALFIAVLVVKPMSHRAMSSYGWILIELSLAAFLCWFVTTTGSILHRILEFPLLAWIGRISYGLYLWHPPIFSQVGGLPLPGFVKVSLMLVITLAVATFSHYALERPFLRIKSRLRTPA